MDIVSAKRTTWRPSGRASRRHLRPVGDGQQVVGDDHRHREHGLEVGLVPAREGTAAVGGLHLAGGDDPLVALLVLVGRAVPAAELVVQRAGEGQREAGLRPGGQRRGQRERDPLVLVVDRPCDGGLRPVGGDHRRGEGELGRVADQLVRRLVDDERDVDGAGEAGAVEVGFEDEVVADRVDGARQPVGVARHATSVGQPPGRSGRPGPVADGRRCRSRRRSCARRRPGRSGTSAAAGSRRTARPGPSRRRRPGRRSGPGRTAAGTGSPPRRRTACWPQGCRTTPPRSRRRAPRTPGFDHGSPVLRSFNRAWPPSGTTTAPPTDRSDRTTRGPSRPGPGG